MKKEAVIKLLGRACAKLGGTAEFARAHRVTYEYVRAVRAGKREPGKAILDALGLEKMPADYRRKERKDG